MCQLPPIGSTLTVISASGCIREWSCRSQHLHAHEAFSRPARALSSGWSSRLASWLFNHAARRIAMSTQVGFRATVMQAGVQELGPHKLASLHVGWVLHGWFIATLHRLCSYSWLRGPMSRLAFTFNAVTFCGFTASLTGKSCSRGMLPAYTDDVPTRKAHFSILARSTPSGNVHSC